MSSRIYSACAETSLERLISKLMGSELLIEVVDADSDFEIWIDVVHGLAAVDTAAPGSPSKTRLNWYSPLMKRLRDPF